MIAVYDPMRYKVSPPHSLYKYIFALLGYDEPRMPLISIRMTTPQVIRDTREPDHRSLRAERNTITLRVNSYKLSESDKQWMHRANWGHSLAGRFEKMESPAKWFNRLFSLKDHLLLQLLRNSSNNNNNSWDRDRRKCLSADSQGNDLLLINCKTSKWTWPAHKFVTALLSICFTFSSTSSSSVECKFE